MKTQIVTSSAVSRRDLLLGRTRLPSVSPHKPTAKIGSHCLSIRGIACRSCDDTCAVRAIRFRPQLGGHIHPTVDVGLCTGCGDCLSVCPVTALALEEDAADA